jgi:predicted phage tail protein
MSLFLYPDNRSTFNYAPLPLKEKEPLLLIEEAQLLTPAAAPEENIRELAAKEKKIRDKATAKTFRVAVTGNDLGFEDNKQYVVVVGIVEGRFRYAISDKDMGPIQAGSMKKAAIGAGLLAVTGVSFLLAGQGLVTKALTTATHSLAIPTLSKIPCLPPLLMPLLFSAILLTGNHFVSGAIMEFAAITTVALLALMLKKTGKSLACGGWMSAKHMILPYSKEESASRELTRFEIFPQEGAVQTDRKVEVIITEEKGDVFSRIQIGDKSFDPVKMASKIGEDDDDDDDEIEEKPKKKVKASPYIQGAKEWGIVATATVATIVSNFFLGQGITTGAFNAVGGASCKAKVRQLPIINGYGTLIGLSGLFYMIKVLTPENAIGDIVLSTLSMMCLSILVSTMTKDMKDRVLSPKRPKNEDSYSLSWVERGLNLQPARPYQGGVPIPGVIEKGNKGALKAAIPVKATSVDMKFYIENEKLCAEYLGITKKEQSKLGLARVKVEKPGAWAMYSFIVASIALTIFASWATRQASLASLKGDLRIDTSKLGEGVVPNIFNSVFVTFMKQVGGNFPCMLINGALLPLTFGAVVLERHLISSGSPLPFLWAFIFTSAMVGVWQKWAKKFVNAKPYFPDNWLIPEGIKEVPAAFQSSLDRFLSHELPKSIEVQKQEALI